VLRRVLRLDSTQALIAAQSCAAIVIGYGLALRFDWKASSVATTVIVLQTAALGSTLNKAMLRMAGTLAGAVVGLALVASFAHDRVLFILGMALLTGVCVWAMQKSSHGYAWMLVVLTGAIVGWPAATNPLTTIQTIVDRVTAVTVGVILSALTQGVFWPVTASRQFERSMLDLVKGCREILRLVRRGLIEQEMDKESIATAESKLLSLSTTLTTTLEAARADSKRLDKYSFGYQQLGDELIDLFLATSAIADASIQVPQGSTSAALESTIESVDRECAATIEQFSLPRDGTSRVSDNENAPLDSIDDGPQFVHTSQLEDALVTSLLEDRLHTFGKVAARVRNSLAEVEDPRRSIQPETPPPAPGPAPRVRMMKSALATLQVLLAALLFVALNWPLGLQSSMMLVMILAYMNAQMPVALLTRPILKSVAIALPLAAVFHFVLMPRVDNFAELAPWLVLLFFPLMYGVASHNPSKSLAALVSVLLVNSLISVSTTPPSYDFASFANAYLGVSGGFGVVLLLAYLFETRSPRRGLHKLLSAMISESVDYLKQLDDHPHSTPKDPELAKRYRKQSLSSLAKKKKLLALVDFRQDPRAGRDKLEVVMRTFDALTLKLIWSTQATADNPSIGSVRDWCVDSLTATEIAFGACHPISIDLPSKLLLDDMDSAARRAWQSSDSNQMTAANAHILATRARYYRSLVTAISDCQRELNTVDWKRWSQDYF
jgi:uncharacterized membrane protein YccC